jgi:hypothetical protein
MRGKIIAVSVASHPWRGFSGHIRQSGQAILFVQVLSVPLLIKTMTPHQDWPKQNRADEQTFSSRAHDFKQLIHF